MQRIVKSFAVLSILLCGIAFGEPAFEPVAPGIERITLQTRSRDNAPPMNVWVYRSHPWTARDPRPCVLIAASGSNGLTGAQLDDDQVPEHLPYVAQGCVVIAFDVDGVITADTDAQQYTPLIRAYMESQGGLNNAKAALAAAMKIEPRIDTGRLFAAGHGSGANVALLLAARDERIRAVVAFSPLGDVIERIGAPSISAINTAVPGFEQFLRESQPLALAEMIKSRTMLFHPADDEIAPITATLALAEKMKAAGNEPLLDRPRTGGHVEAMLSTGLQRGADWIGEMAKRMPTTKPAGDDIKAVSRP